MHPTNISCMLPLAASATAPCPPSRAKGSSSSSSPTTMHHPIDFPAKHRPYVLRSSHSTHPYPPYTANHRPSLTSSLHPYRHYNHRHWSPPPTPRRREGSPFPEQVRVLSVVATRRRPAPFVQNGLPGGPAILLGTPSVQNTCRGNGCN